MKKLMMLFVATLMIGTAATAQNKIDVEGAKKKVAASDADIANPKKSDKAATWINRGNVYHSAATNPYAGIYKGITELEVKVNMKDPSEVRQETVNGIPFNVLVYPTVDLYVPEGGDQVIFWKTKASVVDNPLETAYAAYEKAVEIDPKQLKKVAPMADKVADSYREQADLSFTQGNYKAAAEAFGKAYAISTGPIVNAPDTLSAYNAGYVSVLAEDSDNGLKYLGIVKDLGYLEDGELYFLLYHAYNGKGDAAEAENALKEGIQLFPANSKLIETLILHYTSTGQDASQMIPMVQQAIQNDPTNYVYHFGLGMIYERLNDFDQAAASFRKAAELNPGDFNAVFNEAITYVRQGEAMIPELGEIPINEPARYEEKLEEVNSYYKKAISVLIKAYELNPEEPATVELLKNIYFRFRDESPEMMENYEKYNALFQQM